MNERRKGSKIASVVDDCRVGSFDGRNDFRIRHGNPVCSGDKEDLFGLSVGIFVNSSCIAGYSVSFVYLFLVVVGI